MKHYTDSIPTIPENVRLVIGELVEDALIAASDNPIVTYGLAGWVDYIIEDYERAMNSRLCDLQDLIGIEAIMEIDALIEDTNPEDCLSFTQWVIELSND